MRYFEITQNLIVAKGFHFPTSLHGNMVLEAHWAHVVYALEWENQEREQ